MRNAPRTNEGAFIQGASAGIDEFQRVSTCVAGVSRQPAVSFRERLPAARSGSSSAEAHAERDPTPHPPPFPCGGMIGISDGDGTPARAKTLRQTFAFG